MGLKGKEETNTTTTTGAKDGKGCPLHVWTPPTTQIIYSGWSNPYCDFFKGIRLCAHRIQTNCIRRRLFHYRREWTCTKCRHVRTVLSPEYEEKQIVHTIILGPDKDYCEHGCWGTPPAANTAAAAAAAANNAAAPAAADAVNI